MKKRSNKEITNTGEVCLNCHKRKGLHKTDKEGNHLYCYMDDSLDEFVGKNELKMNIEKEITICYNRIRDLKQQLKKLDNQSQEKQSAKLTDKRGVKSPSDTKLKEIK